MISYSESRTGNRYKSQAEISYTFSGTQNLFFGKVTDFSKKGLCFETGYEIKPGAKINIFNTDGYDAGLKLALDDECQAEVKWITLIPGKDAFFYRVGVPYSDPINDHQCQFVRGEA